MPFQSDAPEGSDTSQWPVRKKSRRWDLADEMGQGKKNPMVHS